MKKIILMVLGLVLTVALFACGDDKGPADKDAPVISGVANKVAIVEDEVNLLEGVTAKDEVDGDLTANIQVTTLPAMTVTNGKVTPASTGDYEIAYTVKDKAGNVGEAFCTLTVNPKLAPKTKYKEYSFGLPEDLPFSAWSFDGLDVYSGVVKGNYRVNCTQPDGEAWHIKFEGHTPTVSGADYTVKYNFNSDVAGNICFESIGTQWKEFIAGNNTLEFEFTASETKDDQYFCLQLGQLEPFTIDFVSIEIKESIGEDVWANEIPAFAFNNDNTSANFDDNSDGSLVLTDNTKAQLVITKGSNGNNVWETRMYVKAGVDLKKDVKYRISVDMLADKAIDAFEICYNSGDQEKAVGALYGQSINADEKKTIEYIVIPEKNLDNLVLQFQVGKANTQGDSNEIVVSNLKVEHIVAEDEVVLENYTFNNEKLANHFWSASEGTFTAAADGKSAVMNITKGTDTPNCWEIWAVIALGQSLEANKTYVIEMDVDATADTTDGIEAVLRTFNQEDTRGGHYGIQFKAGETFHVRMEINLQEAMDNPAVCFQLGAIQTANTLTFSNLKVTALGGSKVETSKSYNFAPVGFGTYNEGPLGEGFLYIEDSKLVYEMTKIALVDWHNKLYISRLELEADKIYTIEFVAKADKEISCAFFLNPVGKWDPRVSEEVNFKTTSTTYSFVTPKFAADMAFEVLFQFGSDANNKLGSATIEFESIIIWAQDVE